MDMSLDDIIADGSSRGGGAAGSRGARSRTTVTISRKSTAKSAASKRKVGAGAAGKASARGGKSESSRGRGAPLPDGYKHISTDSLDDIANADEKSRTLKVGKDTNIKRLAGSITYILDQCGSAPTLLAGGSAAINQACKAMAIVRRVLAGRDDGTDIAAQATFDGGSVRCVLNIEVLSEPIESAASDDDLLVKPASNPGKVAGAIAGRLRDDAAVALQAVGPEPVFHTVRAIAFARRYLADDNIDIVFSPAWSEIETDSGTTTGLHFAINTVG